MKEIYIEQQTSKYFPKQINRFGCYFLSILWGASEFLNLKLDSVQVMELYEEAIKNKYMTKSCYINNPAKVGTLALNKLGRPDLRFYYVGSERDGVLSFYNESLKEKINHTIDNIQIMWEDKEGSLHNGSHFMTEEYNPDTDLILTGKVFGHRYFFIGEK
jgi:hypothetical protein